MVQVDRPGPLFLVSLVPRRSEDPLLLVPFVPLRSEDPLLLVPLVPRLPLVPTCPIWLYHLSFANSLFSDLFLGFSVSFHFFDEHIWMKKFLPSTIMLEKVQMTTKFMVNWRFRAIFPLCASEIKKIFALWCVGAEPFRCEVYKCFRTESQQRDKQNPIHKIIATVLYCFRRVLPRRRLRTQSSKFTCVGLGTKRLAPFAHSVLVITLSHTSLAALVCLWRLLRVGSCIVFPILRPRCRWTGCRLFLIVHLDAPRVGIVIRVMLTWRLRVAACSFSLCSLDHLHAWVSLVKENRFLVRIFDQFQNDSW